MCDGTQFWVSRALLRERHLLCFFLKLTFGDFFIIGMDFQQTDKVEGVGDDFARGGQDETPIKPRRNSRQRRIVVSAGTPTVIVTAGNEQFCAPWTAESPGGTVTTSAYNEDGKKRCRSVHVVWQYEEEGFGTKQNLQKG